MKNRHKAVTVTNEWIIVFIILLIIDCFLIINWKSKGSLTEQNTIYWVMTKWDFFLMHLILYWILTIITGYYTISFIKKNLKLKKNINLKKQWLLQPIITKVIRFDLEHIWESTNTGHFCIITSNWKTEFSSEPIESSITWYNPIKLMPLWSTSIIWFKFNMLEIESSINELEKIQTPTDIKTRMKNADTLSIFTKITQALTGWRLYKWILSDIKKCEEYLKKISKNSEFKNSYLEYKNQQIHIWDNITVYIDPNDPTVYQVDTDFLYN